MWHLNLSILLCLISKGDFECMKTICLILYYGFARFLPTSYTPIVGKPSKWIRYQLCRNIFAKCGKNVNVERGAFFGSGSLIEIGDNSGIGVNCHIPSNTKIGNNVMMTPGRVVKRGSVVAAGCVLCKDFPEYSIVGGNPSRFIKSRL